MSKRAFETGEQLAELVNEPDILAEVLKDDGVFPNSILPLLLYREAVLMPEHDPAAIFEQLFESNGWSRAWRNGIYSYHHYHSTAHEVLGVFSGSAKVKFGGDDGAVHDLKRGDVVVIPAGVAHMNVNSSGDFGVVGAYANGKTWDMNYGKPNERPRADTNILRVPIPNADPVYGSTGPLLDNWTP